MVRTLWSPWMNCIGSQVLGYNHPHMYWKLTSSIEIPAVIVEVYMSTSQSWAIWLMFFMSSRLLSMWNSPFSSMAVCFPWYLLILISPKSCFNSPSRRSDCELQVTKTHDLPLLLYTFDTFLNISWATSACLFEMYTFAVCSVKGLYIFSWIAYYSIPFMLLNRLIDDCWRNPSITIHFLHMEIYLLKQSTTFTPWTEFICERTDSHSSTTNRSHEVSLNLLSDSIWITITRYLVSPSLK